jgi:FMN phosphatase YigB (HAD superfamily)
MKTILVDAINALVLKDSGLFNEMLELLEQYPNPKIVLTGANDEQIKKFSLDILPYTVFTLKHNPEKTDSKYYKLMLEHFSLNPKEVIYFEHNYDAAESASSIGIKTFYYDKYKKDLIALKKFIDENL